MRELTEPRPIISIVVPLYCEQANLKALLVAIQNVLDSLSQPSEVILVDDGSTDNTWEIISRLCATEDRLRAVRLSRNFGKEAALSAGLELSEGEAVIVMDGDLQHPPSLIPEMVRLWSEQQADIVEAVKASRGPESVTTKVQAKLFYTILNTLSGYDLDGLSDYKLMDRKVVSAWLQMKERNIFFRGMIAWLGFSCIRIPFTVPGRAAGKSRWSAFRLIKLALTAVTAFSTLPLHFTTMLGLGFLFFAILLGAQTLYLKATGMAVSGFTTVILLILITGSGLMIGLGVIGEYIARIYKEVKGRPRYVVARTIQAGQMSQKRLLDERPRAGILAEEIKPAKGELVRK